MLRNAAAWITEWSLRAYGDEKKWLRNYVGVCWTGEVDFSWK